MGNEYGLCGWPEVECARKCIDKSKLYCLPELLIPFFWFFEGFRNGRGTNTEEGGDQVPSYELTGALWGGGEGLVGCVVRADCATQCRQGEGKIACRAKMRKKDK